ncbi:hypothetical protein [Microbacterium maritypicum]
MTTANMRPSSSSVPSTSFWSFDAACAGGRRACRRLRTRPSGAPRDEERSGDETDDGGERTKREGHARREVPEKFARIARIAY